MSLNQILRNDANPVGIYDVRLKTVECKELLAEALTILNLTTNKLNIENKTGAATLDFKTSDPLVLNAHITSTDTNTEIKAFRGNLDYSANFHDFRNVDGKLGVELNLNRITAEPDNQPGTINFMKNSVTESSITGSSSLTLTCNNGSFLVNALRARYDTAVTYNYPPVVLVQDTVNKDQWTSDVKTETTFRVSCTVLVDYEWKQNADVQITLNSLPSDALYGNPMITNLTFFDINNSIPATSVIHVYTKNNSLTSKTVYIRNIGPDIGPEANPGDPEYFLSFYVTTQLAHP